MLFARARHGALPGTAPLALLALGGGGVLVGIPAPHRLVVCATPAALRIHVDDKHDWFDVRGAIEVDDAEVDLAGLLEAARAQRRSVQLGPDRWPVLARALAIVKFLRGQGIPPERLGATGYGEFHPLDARSTEGAYTRNRRIALKLTSR